MPMKFALVAFVVLTLPALGACHDTSAPATENGVTVDAPEPDDREAALHKIRALLVAREAHPAVAAAWMFLQEHPEDPDGQVLLASAYVMAQRFEEGLREAEKACATPTPSAGARLTLAAALHGLDRSGEAVATLRALITDEPDHQGALVNLARYHGSLRQWEAQAGVLTRLTRLRGDDAAVFVDLAAARLRAGDTAGAEEAARGAVERAPYSAATHVALATALFARDGFLETMDRLNIALRLRPDLEEGQALFQAAFYLAAAVELRCAHGRGPWTDAQITTTLKRYQSEGLEDVEVWRRWHRDHGQDEEVLKRLETAALRCPAAQ